MRTWPMGAAFQINKRGGVRVLSTLVATLGLASAFAQEAVRHEVRIAAAPIGTALKTLADQTGLQLLVFSQDADDKRAPPVQGKLTNAEALEIILRNSGLTYQQIDEKTVAIRPAKSAAPDKGKPIASSLWAVPSPTRLAQANDPIPTSQSPEQPVEPQAAKLEEVVVTAQKRTESLQSVPISVQVINSQTLAEQNHNSFQELTETTPGLHIADNTFANDLFIRGIGSGQGSVGGNPGFDQSVSTFVDDVYYGRSRMTDASFLDLDRIEVLKGPQSTFFGNNAIAGALNIVTKKPGDSFEATVRALYGMYGEYASEGAVTVPISSTLSVRAAAAANGMRGWADNINTGGHDPERQGRAGRITLLYRPTEQLDATLKVEGGRDRFGPEPQFWGNCPPAARAALILQIRDGLTYQQIAQQMNATPRMVKRYLLAAYAQLRARVPLEF